MKSRGLAPRMLVVEDDPTVRSLVSRHLRNRGLDVVDVGDAEAVFLGLVQGDIAYDVALVDVHLPGLSGMELLRYLLARSPAHPVILMTADVDEGLAWRALALRPAGFLLKPFELKELDAVVDRALSRLGGEGEAGGEEGAPEMPGMASPAAVDEAVSAIAAIRMLARGHRHTRDGD